MQQQLLTGLEDVHPVIREGIALLCSSNESVEIRLSRIDITIELGDRKTINYCGDIRSKSEEFHLVVTHVHGLDPENPFDTCGLSLELHKTRQHIGTLEKLLSRVKPKYRRHATWTFTGSDRSRNLIVSLVLLAFTPQQIAADMAALLDEAIVVSSVARQLETAYEQAEERARASLEQMLRL